VRRNLPDIAGIRWTYSQSSEGITDLTFGRQALCLGWLHQEATAPLRRYPPEPRGGCEACRAKIGILPPDLVREKIRALSWPVSMLTLSSLLDPPTSKRAEHDCMKHSSMKSRIFFTRLYKNCSALPRAVSSEAFWSGLSIHLARAETT